MRTAEEPFCTSAATFSSIHQGELAQMAERSPSMREAAGSMPAFSNAFPSPCLDIRPAALGTRVVPTVGLWRTWAASGLLRTTTASSQHAGQGQHGL